MSITIFAADDGLGGIELWRTDGTTGRTSLILDINPGVTGSNPSNLDIFSRPILPFAVLNGFAYFSANDGVHGSELWRTDGTAAGTVEVTDRPGGGYAPLNILTANNLLFFESNGPSGLGIYSSTGVVGSTPSLVAATTGLHGMIVSGDRIYWNQNSAGAASGIYTWDALSGVQKLTSDVKTGVLLDAGGVLYASSVTTSAMYKISGTTVTPIQNSPGPALASFNVGQTVFFSHDDTGEGDIGIYAIVAGSNSAVEILTEFTGDFGPGSEGALGSHMIFANFNGFIPSLWISDGTVAGTVKLSDVGVSPQDIGGFTTVGSSIFFQVLDHSGGFDLWKTDGTAAGTAMIKQIEAANPGAAAGAASLFDMTAQGGLLYFSASDGADGRELWRSDGTADGTYQVRAINNTTISGVNTLNHSFDPHPASFGGLTYFTAVDPVHGAELWTTDGTALGTHLFKDINPGFLNSIPSMMGVSGAQLFFVANDGVHGSELWVSDGTAAGTHMARDIMPGGGSGQSSLNLTGTPVFGDSMIFVAYDGISPPVNGTQLWISTGTEAGTRLFSDAFAGADGRYAVSGSRLFYTTSPDNTGEHLWVSDGTPGGTHEITQIPGTSFNIDLFNTATLGNNVFFGADDGVHGKELWKSDGTAAGTFMLKDIVAGATSSQPGSFEVANGKLFFEITTNGSDGQIWTTDGTAANTVEISQPAWTFRPLIRAASGNSVYFSGSETGGGNYHLYATDGTAPVLLDPGSTSSPGDFAPLNGGLVFTDTDSTHGTELWFSGGTTATTGMVADINPSGSSQIANMTLAGNHVFFTAFDGTHATELWVSDGTAAGTHLLKSDAAVSNLHAAGNSVEFTATGAGSFVQNWISDGTAAGTFVINANTVSGDSTPSPFTLLPGNLDSGPETLNGTALGDHLDGGAGNDTLNGLAGDDVLTGGAGNDTIDGGDGNDVAVFSGNFANQPQPDETFTFDPLTTTIVVTDSRGGTPDGTDTLTHVETIKFADGYVQFDLDGSHPWLTNPVSLDAQGSVVGSTFNGDNGASWSNYVDTANASSVLWQTTQFDANGAAIATTTTNDDGTHALTIFDNTNSYSFTSATIQFDAAWNQTGMTELNDDSSTTLRPTLVWTALDTVAWYVTPYDPDQGAAVVNALTGGGNTDVLYGFAGDDVLNGGGGNDILSGGKGDDLLTGGGGDDRFLFSYGDGNDIVTDFVAGNGSNDTIVLHDYGIANFAALQMAQVGADTVITFDTYNHIVLQNVTMSALNAGDFVFT